MSEASHQAEVYRVPYSVTAGGADLALTKYTSVFLLKRTSDIKERAAAAQVVDSALPGKPLLSCSETLCYFRNRIRGVESPYCIFFHSALNIWGVLK